MVIEFERIHAVFIKEVKQMLRDPRLRIVLFIVPILQVLLFGYAATTDIKNISTAVYDLDNTPQSRDVIRAFTYSKYFTAKYYIYDDEKEKALIDKSLVNVVIRLNHGFGKDLEGDRGAAVQLIIDGTDSNTAAIISSYANSIVQRYSSKILNERSKVYVEKLGPFPSVDLRGRAWFNENLESRFFYIPGVIALIITVQTIILTAMAVVREKEIGTMEQLVVSPIKPYELIIGKMIPYGMVAIIDVVFVTIVGVLLFHVPIRGNLILLLGATMVYLLACLGTGLLISTSAKTQQEAMLSTFFFLFPINLFSGFMFPIFNMPYVIQLLTYLNPMRYYITILRGIFLKGVGIDILWPQILILFGMGVIIIAFSSMKFHKTLG